uniref:Uncharacterized protein n=1 Tax=Setaria italica TaxID=4555 RepID=K3Z140_SETIT
MAIFQGLSIGRVEWAAVLLRTSSIHTVVPN